MEPDELQEILQTLRRFGAEPSAVEVKSGASGFPGSVRESMVAFANTEGGLIIIGIDESDDFAVVDVPAPGQYRDRLIDLSRSAVTPPLTVETSFAELDGKRIVVASVAPLPADQKPAYVTSKGISNGAYLRAGDGDRRMSEAEIALLWTARTQPAYDAEPVPAASPQDLNTTTLARTLERVRLSSAYLRESDDVTTLHRIGVLAAPHADAPPTLAGLLAFGRFPQQFFPQLMVSAVVHPSDDDTGTRFLDNTTLRGPIPEMVSEVLAFLRRNLAARAVTVDGGREDRLDFPVAAMREAVVNALMHRDYSPVTRGTQVQVDLHPDRLVIRSPGGLYGPISEEDLGEVEISSSRNAVLAQLLSDVYLPRSDQLVAENRASGIPIMLTEARRNGLPRPVFRSRVTSFTVTMGRSALLGPDVRTWLNTLPVQLPTPAHEIALAMMRDGGFATNAALREWGVDHRTAGSVLRDLTSSGVAVRHGGRRYARYVLNPQQPVPRGSAVAAALADMGTATAAELQKRTGLSRAGVTYQLKRLVAEGQVRAVGAPRSPHRSYAWQPVAPAAADAHSEDDRASR